jgi:hypothetical protein
VLTRAFIANPLGPRRCNMAVGSAGTSDHAVEIVSLLLEAAPLERHIAYGLTPLRAPIIKLLRKVLNPTPGEDYNPRAVVEMVRLLLRHGAPLDDSTDCTRLQPREFSADFFLRECERRNPEFLHNEAFVEIKAMTAGVRACGGSWKSYCRLPHKQILRLRSLVSRGRARPRREPILQQLRFRRTIPILKKRAAAYRSIVFLCKLGDNGVVWTILEFWQATR